MWNITVYKIFFLYDDILVVIHDIYFIPASHDSSKIILICWFGVQLLIMVLINNVNLFAA